MSFTRPAPLLPEFSSPSFTPTAPYNPKAITNASASAPVAKPAPSAPYLHLDFHTNPRDSIPELTAHPAVSARVITWVRRVSVVLRAVQLLGALGLLVILLLLRGIEESQGWFCRIPPGVATLHFIYALYHSASSHRLKTPASAKAYHFFSITLDLAVVVFYTLIALLAWRNTGVWGSIFKNATTERALTITTFSLAVAGGGIALVLIAIGAYMVAMMARLQRLPPDLNPFAEMEKEKRWSVATTESATGLLSGEKRTVDFAATRRQKAKKEGLTYQAVELEMDLADVKKGYEKLADSSAMDSKGWSGSGYDTPVTAYSGASSYAPSALESTPATSMQSTKTTLENGYGRIRGLSTPTMYNGTPISSPAVSIRNSAAPASPKGSAKKSSRIEEALRKLEGGSQSPPRVRPPTMAGPRSMKRTSTHEDESSKRNSGQVLGFSKKALLEARGGEARFRKVSGEGDAKSIDV